MATTNPPKPLFLEDGRRLSGRNQTDLRNISIEVGVLKKASGSARVSWGKNIVLAAVYGPREVVPKHLTNPNAARVNFRYIMTPFCSLEEHGRSGPNRRSIEISKVLKHVFENAILINQFPKTQIDISAEILQSDGGTRISALIASSLALIDAGLPVKDIISGVSIGKIGGKLVVDLDKDEDNFGESDMPVAFSLRTGEILLFQMDGMLTVDELSEGLDMAYDACVKVRAKQVEALKSKYLTPVEQSESVEGA